MQRQRQEERESFQQAQRQYSSLPRYGNCLKLSSVCEPRANFVCGRKMYLVQTLSFSIGIRWNVFSEEEAENFLSESMW